MKNEHQTYASGWVRHGYIYAYPYLWQTPARTEEYAYEVNLSNTENSNRTQLIFFPWATLIDAIEKNQVDLIEKLSDALNNRPPKIALKIVTVCQHIKLEEHIGLFKLLGITDIFWSHKTVDTDSISKIKLHPYPLYPAAYFSIHNDKKTKPIEERRFLYSFIGAYSHGLYIDDSREKIFRLPKSKDIKIKKRGEWHFENHVYKNQIEGKPLSNNEKRETEEIEYISTLKETVYSLCPNGSGPNTIRLWESLMFGCIPACFGLKIDTRKWKKIDSLLLKLESKDIQKEVKKLRKPHAYRDTTLSKKELEDLFKLKVFKNEQPNNSR